VETITDTVDLLALPPEQLPELHMYFLTDLTASAPAAGLQLMERSELGVVLVL
jgi:hypothetical protein